MKMLSLYNCFITIFLTISLNAPIRRSQRVTCNSNDLRALTSFSNCMESGIEGWNISTSNCCTWNGVTCDDSTSKRIVSLQLGGKRLAGTLCESLEGLDQLRLLNLSNNFLRGYPPVKLLQLQNLEVLDLSQNEFTGSIPEESNLPSIRYVDLSMNSFNSSVGTTLCETSPHIQVLNLAHNFFTDISGSFGRCTSLQHLFLNGNGISGNFPSSILQLSDLRTLHLEENFFAGPLSNGIGNLSNLVELDISSNMFSGILPDVFENLGKLEHFLASSNKFSGHFPNSLGNLPSLAKLDLRNNTLSGPIFLNCSAMIHLSFLDIGSNNFHGPIPDSMSSCQRLTKLNLGRNNLSGEVPFAFKNLKSLITLSLSNTSLVNISSALAVLQHCENLTFLFLSMNFKDEQMPSDVNLHFRNLEALIIGNCDLRGSIPIWLSNSPGLQFLDLSWNQLSGAIPFWFHGFKSLFYIDLSNNFFTGKIPKTLTELPGLLNRNVSLAGTSLGFPLYQTPRVGTRLMYIDIWRFPPTIDLSNNRLTGPIWPSFGNLRGLHVLYLKENGLSGIISHALSGMTSLERLDLSHNELSGEILPSLEKLNFLSEFNVSYNKLYGVIPTGGQFMTFPRSSFQGNKGLCGGDLTPCQLPPQGPRDQLVHERMSIVDLQFGIGAAVGFLSSVAFFLQVELGISRNARCIRYIHCIRNCFC